MSKLIIVCGLPGSGKTALAKELSHQLNIICLHKDSIKESLYDISGGETLEDSKSVGKWSIQLLLNLAEEQIRNGVDIILESPFNHKDETETFANWKEKYSLDFYAVICEIEEDIRRNRYENRAFETRHPSHHDRERLVLAKDGNGSFDGLMGDVNYSIMPEKRIFVTTDRSPDRLVADIISEII